MSIELTDAKRYELELDNCLSVLLCAARSGKPFTEADLARALSIDQATTNKLIIKLKQDNIIK